MAIEIKSVELSLFKSFKKTRVKFEGGLNLLVGANNSGKSTILQAIYLAFDFLKLTKGISEFDRKRAAKDARLRGSTIRSITLPFHEDSYIAEGLKRRSIRDRATNIRIGLSEGVDFMETITFPGGNLLVFSSDGSLHAGTAQYRKRINNIVKQQKRFPLFIPSFAGVATKEEIKVSEVIKHYIASGRSNEVLRNQLKNISKSKINLLNKYLKLGFDVEISGSKIKEILLSSLYRVGDYNLDISAAGSGFQQILQILVYIVTSSADIILIDEPDAHLHYRLQNILYDILRELTENDKQIIVATHSQIFIKRALQHDDRLILTNTELQEQKSIRKYDESLRVLYEEGLISEDEVTQGGMTNIIGIEDSKTGMGFKIIKEFLRKLGVHEPKYTFVSTKGHGTDIFKYVTGKRKIEKLFLRSVVIRDSDSLPKEYTKEIIKKLSKDYSKLIYLNVNEVENYLINSAVISRVMKLKGVKINTSDIENIVSRIVRKQNNRDDLLDILDSSIEGHLKNDNNYKWAGLKYDEISVKTRERKKEIRTKHMKYPFELLPGKKLFKLFKQQVRINYGVSISEIKLAKEFKKDELPKELYGIAKFLK